MSEAEALDHNTKQREFLTVHSDFRSQVFPSKSTTPQRPKVAGSS